jgi:hypothetical protein
MNACELLQKEMGELFHCSRVNNRVRIRTPFMYPDGDYIDLFASTSGDVTTLSDLGETVRWLRMQTTAPRRTAKQKQMIDDIRVTHGVEFFRGMLELRVRPGESFAAGVTRLAQAALRVADLWFTFRARAFESISDEVSEFLLESQVPFDRGEWLLGRSGRNYTVDFHVRTPKRSSLVTVLSTGSHSATRRIVEHVVATWFDLSHLKVGPEALQFVSLFDDTLDVWDPEDFKLVEEVATVARWSAPEEFRSLLLAG